MTPPRVVFVNRFYWPDEPATAQLLTDLATAMARENINVCVIASRPKDKPAPPFEENTGVAIYRVSTFPGNGGGVFRRLIDFCLFHVAAGWRLWRLLRRDDIAVAMTDPPLLGVTVWLVAALRGAQLIHWVQDIYPEIAAELTGHRWLLGLRPVRDLVWRRSRACIVPGRDMAGVIQRAGAPAPKVLVSPNWAPAGLGPASASEIASVRAEWNLGGRLVLAYSGNLGRAHDLTPILELAEIFRREDTIAFVFIGGGPQRQSLESAARARGLANVRFLPSQPRHRLAATLGVGDVHFVTLRPGAEHYVFPSKLHGIAACGRPVLFIGPRNSEIAALVEKTGLGRSFTRHELPAAADWVRWLRASAELRTQMGAAGLAFAGNDFAQAKAVWRAALQANLAPTDITP